ncbi:YbaB/EbfC family nucleoid-associated protein [Micromonospora sp. NPDC049559]|uniref:YbaB/EbfC family nucleoid-associated protein n=1 Tax=Micromonospora sp. NPDC049559 TaxID=3155923 RepID=UPI00342E5C90
MFGADPDDAEAWIRSWTAQVSARASAAAELADRVAMIKATASGADGAIRVTVDGSGVPSELRLDDRVQRMRGEELAGEIMRVLRKAQASLADEVGSVVHATVGSDSETGRAVIDSFERRFPAPLPDDDDRWGGESRDGR